MTRIALIGCGHIGTVHSVALKKLRSIGEIDAVVTATFDLDPSRAEEMAAHHGAVAASSVEAACDLADVAWICTWTSGHLPAVRAAVERSMPVFCEKPLAPTLDECEEIARLLRRVPHQVGLVLRHAPVFATIAEMIHSGRYGAPMVASLRDDQYFPIQGMYNSTWRADVARAGGGTLIEHSVHDVDVLGWLFGDPESVSARVVSHFGYPGIEDAVTAQLAYPSGMVATLISVWHQVMTRPSTRRLEVFCEEALVWTEDDHLGPLHVETSSGIAAVDLPPPDLTDRLGLPEVWAKPLAAYAVPAKAFLDALASDGAAARGHPDVEVALAAHRVVDAAYRSAADAGRPVAPAAR
ncbi:MAG TPA: Gfo/Idh/MocA family oxidoreductase [Acidimicrobiia bacterium]|nr:Gfo/Idh/MocA family oxidoreductase [Acidimicrobiia bacterium]